jgi:hypothetical protein
MVLAATAIPVELRPRFQTGLDFGIQLPDVLANVAGYVPVGIVLGGLGPVRAILAAAAISTLAEVSQVVMMHRDPSAIDIAANVLGSIVGTMVSGRWRIRSPELGVSRWTALTSAALAVVLILGVWALSGDPLNARGATSPGALEAHWRLDESRGRVASDSSGHHLDGMLSNESMRVPGVVGGAARFNGTTDSISFGHSTGLRLVGSMTVSAWINSTMYPLDDAAIVSTFNHRGDFALGYQLDTTIDRGPRTIGFKLGDPCGNVMARYGATPLLLNTWYHVAGVYDAEAQTMDVYLNGERDNGFLLGAVTGTHRSSRLGLYVGRRADLEGFEFAGLIDDVQIYSRALTKPEIAAIMRAGEIGSTPVGRAPAQRSEASKSAIGAVGTPSQCAWSSEREDARVPGAVATFGVLVAVVCVGLLPSVGPTLCLAASLFAGLLFLPVTASTLPSLKFWMFPLASLAGGASVVASLRRQRDRDP